MQVLRRLKTPTQLRIEAAHASARNVVELVIGGDLGTDAGADAHGQLAEQPLHLLFRGIGPVDAGEEVRPELVARCAAHVAHHRTGVQGRVSRVVRVAVGLHAAVLVHPHELWPFGRHSCVFRSGQNSCVGELSYSPARIVLSGMLTERQLALLRASSPTNRVATAISLAGVTQTDIAAAIGVPQAYVSDVARQRYSTITVANAWKFAKYFACSIDDLFPPHDNGSPSM